MLSDNFALPFPDNHLSGSKYRQSANEEKPDQQ